MRRRTYYDLQGKQKRLHLLKGLKAILLDIDKAIEIVRNTAEETEVVPNLMIGFGIDEVQAEYVAEIKLRHLNREYILKRTEEIEELEDAIADLRGYPQTPGTHQSKSSCKNWRRRQEIRQAPPLRDLCTRSRAARG